MKHFLLIFTFFATNSLAFAQDNSEETYQFLDERIEILRNKPGEQLPYIKKMISKATKSNHLKILHKAFSLAAASATGGDKLKYGDSLIMTALKQKNSDVTGDCYLARGSLFMNEEKYQNALQDYVKGYYFIKRNNNPYLINNAHFLIAQTKIYLGQYDEARNILKKVLSFYRENHKKIEDTDYALYYIYTLISYIDANSHLSNFKENKTLIREGQNFIKKNHYENYASYFLSLEGTDAFHQQNYVLAIEKLDAALALYHDNWKHLTEIFYLGLSHWHKGDQEKAILYLLKIDAEYNKTGKLDPQFRPAIELLIKYYEKLGDTKKQLEIVDHLLALDRTYESDFKYLYHMLQKEYDVKSLKDEKLKLESTLVKEKTIRILVVILSVLLCAATFGILYWSKQRHKNYRKLIDKMYRERETYVEKEISDKNNNAESSIEGSDLQSKDISEINPFVVSTILAYLEKFENEKRFLQKDLSMQQLAQQCGTNITYFSKTVNIYKKDNFLSYITNLRLDYVVELWKKDPDARYYRIQEISGKAGFSTAQSFSKNFKEKYKISPSYFLKHLEMESRVPKK